MRIDPRWAFLAQPDKLGMGTQGDAFRSELKRFNPAHVLYLDGNLGSYAQDYGARSALRIYHGNKKNWKDAEGWASNCASNMALAYKWGCRDLVPINEVWGIEGLSDKEGDYQWMVSWTARFINALERELHARGMKLHPEPDGVRVWLFGPSPGRNYEDNFVGLRYLATAFKDPRVFGSIEHYYWEPTYGFFDDKCSWAGPCRALKVRAKMLELGIDKAVWISEFNRKVQLNNKDDINAYFEQIKRFVAWANSIPWIVRVSYFLWNCNDDSDFHPLTITRMPGMVDKLCTNWDRQSEGEWANTQEVPVPNAYATIGNGYQVLDLRNKLPKNSDYSTRPLSGIKYIVIHHSGVDVDSSAESIAQYHVNSEGWPGIGYHFIVHPDGKTEWTQPLQAASYNVASRNNEVVGICLPGNFTSHAPGDTQIGAARRLAAEVQYQLGSLVPIVGHQDVALSGFRTSCPGNTWPSWKARVIGTAPAPMPAGPQFILGFKELANTLGASVVGTPMENERQATVSLQETSKGIMLWENGKPSRYFAKVG